jgi:HEPN domain-containing protein
MNEKTVQAWIGRAEDDLETGKILMRSEHRIYWVICFHMQQCVEKYLKAFLIFHGREHPRTHNIPVLVELCAQLASSFHELKEWGVRELTRYATVFRYGEESYAPDEEETQRAIELAERVRAFVREKLIEAGLRLSE